MATGWLWLAQPTGVFIVEILMLSKIAQCKLLVVIRVFILLFSVCGFNVNSSAKSTVCESLRELLSSQLNCDCIGSQLASDEAVVSCSFIDIDTTARDNSVEFRLL